jgi:flagellar assembly protein FliH
VGEAASWEFQPLAGGDAPRGTRQLLSERERRAHERGLAEGLAEGRRQVLAERAQHGRELARVLDELRRRFVELEAAGAEQVLDLALSVARAVIRREVLLGRDAVLPALREAVAQVIDQQAHPRVYLNPQDFELIRPDLEADGLLAGCRLVADGGMARGGCRVETDKCEVDARLENRWKRVIDALGLPEAAEPPTAEPR